MSEETIAKTAADEGTEVATTVDAETSKLNDEVEGQIDQAANLAKEGVSNAKDYVSEHEGDIQDQIDDFAAAAKEELGKAEQFIEEHKTEVAAGVAAVAGIAAVGVMASKEMEKAAENAQQNADATDTTAGEAAAQA